MASFYSAHNPPVTLYRCLLWLREGVESLHACDVSRYVSVALHRCLLCLRGWGVKVGILVSRYLSVALHRCFHWMVVGEGWSVNL